MPYVKKIWQDSPSTATPLNADNLNHIEDGIENVDQRTTALETSIQNVLQYLGEHEVTVTADGSKTYGTLIDEVVTAVNTWLSTQEVTFRYILQSLTVDNWDTLYSPDSRLKERTVAVSEVPVSIRKLTDNGSVEKYALLKASASFVAKDEAGTYTNMTNAVASNNTKFTITLSTFSVIPANS